MKRVLCAVASALVVMLSSCVHREFEYESIDTTYLNVVFDWSEEPSADVASMSLYLYPDNGGKPIRFDFGTRDGGLVRLSPGIYHAICINNDRLEVDFRGGESHSTFEVTTAPAPSLSLGSSLAVRSRDLPKAPGTEAQELISQPPLLWSASLTGFQVEVAPPAKQRTGYQELRMYPSRIVDTYIVTVKHIKNARHLKSLSATISDMADGYFPAHGKPNDTSALLPLALAHNTDNADAVGTFLTFGHCPADQRGHILMLYAVLSDDSKYYFKYDVGEQAHSQPDENGIYHIVVDNIDLPEPTGGGGASGGLSPTVGEWQEIHIGIKI